MKQFHNYFFGALYPGALYPRGTISGGTISGALYPGALSPGALYPSPDVSTVLDNFEHILIFRTSLSFGEAKLGEKESCDI